MRVMKDLERQEVVLGDGTKALGGELLEGEGTTLRRSRAEYPQFHYLSSTKLASGLRQPCVVLLYMLHVSVQRRSN
jgi:hypothetical protein